MSIKIISTNRKAHHEYHIIDKYEAGIALVGSEVKALRESNVTIKESYVKFDVHIGTYRLEYERPRFNNDGAKPSQEANRRQDKPPTKGD